MRIKPKVSSQPLGICGRCGWRGGQRKASMCGMSEEGNYSENTPFIPNMLSVSLKMSCGLHTVCKTIWHVGKVQMMPLTAYRWWRPQRCQPQAKVRPPTLWETRNWAAGGKTENWCHVCSRSSLVFPGKNSDTSGLCSPSSRSFALT